MPVLVTVESSVAPALDISLAVALVAMTTLAIAASYVTGLRVGRDQAIAVLRATGQLTVVALIVGAVLRSFVLAFVFVLVMLAVAGLTSARRMAVPPSRTPWVVVALTLGAAPVIAIALLTGVLPLNALGLLPYAGIVIGGTMTAATLTGRRAGQELEDNRGHYEAALALGMTSREAASLVLQPRAAEGLLPGLDQTRTVGLVTLPGAFVGVLLGGGTAADAAAAQVLVLVGLLAAQAITAAVILHLVATRHLMRADLLVSLPQ